MQEKENYLPPENVTRQHVGTLSDPDGSYIFNSSWTFIYLLKVAHGLI